MNLPDNIIFQYQSLTLGLTDLLEGKDINVVIPAVMAVLGSAGAFSGAEKKQFISWVVGEIDRAYEEFEKGKT